MSALERLGITASEIAALQRKYSAAQEQTQSAFAFKWEKRDTYESAQVKENARTWMLERYCGGDPEQLDRWLRERSAGRKLILDAGCGAGFSALLFFGERLRAHDYLGVDISDAVHVARERFSETYIPGDFLQASLTELPIPDGSLDMIFSEGVLHHTDDTGAALKALAAKLQPGGLFLFYVYAKKPPVREFTDDYIREQIRSMSDEEAWDALMPLTALGRELGKLNVQLTITEDVPLLGLKQGTMDLQRFFYWNFCKAYYRPELTLEEMNHINFDWFRPLNCHRHTKEEVESFCKDGNLRIERIDQQEAGITVVARKH